MHCFDSTYIQAAYRVQYDHQLGFSGYLASQQQFLQITAAHHLHRLENRSQLHIKIFYDTFCRRYSSFTPNPPAFGKFTVIFFQDHVIDRIQIWHQPHTQTILRHITDTCFDHFFRFFIGKVLSVKKYFSAHRRPQSGKYLSQLALTVARYSGDTINFTRSDCKPDIVQSNRIHIIES